VFEARRALLTSAGAAAYVRSTAVFLYPDWWLNENIKLLEEREKVVIPAFPPAEIVASRIDAIVAFDRTADLPNIRVPTLVICAKDDILTPPYFSRALARAIPAPSWSSSSAADIARRRRARRRSTMRCWGSSRGVPDAGSAACRARPM
jgi:pimeloyl-ACP methyl ester carboxylesterase